VQLTPVGVWPAAEYLVQHRSPAGADHRQAAESLRGQADPAGAAVLAVGPARHEPEPLELA
jgi:hypothetical protein